MSLVYGSLFSGIGGLDLGMDAASMDCAFQCEIDPYALKILQKHWPMVPRFADVREVTSDSLNERGIELPDVLVGGFPCQDISHAGARAGLAGARSGLFFEFVRVARELAPQWLLIENVKGLLSSSGGRDMGTVIGALGKLGYGVTYRLLDSQYFGLAQRRERVFIVGHLGAPWSASLEVLFEREGSPWDPAPGGVTKADASRRVRAGAKGNVASRPREALAELNGEEQFQEVVSSLIRTGIGTCGPDDNQAQAGHLIPDRAAGVEVAATLNSGGNEGGFRTEPGEHLVVEQFPTHEVSPTLQERGFKGADSDATQAFVLEEPIWMANGQDIAIAQGMTGAITGSNGQPGNVTAESLVRRLTPTECERLQGFPDGWTEGISDSRRYKALGNAVSVPVSSWIAKRMVVAK